MAKLRTIEEKLDRLLGSPSKAKSENDYLSRFKTWEQIALEKKVSKGGLKPPQNPPPAL